MKTNARLTDCFCIRHNALDFISFFTLLMMSMNCASIDAEEVFNSDSNYASLSRNSEQIEILSSEINGQSLSASIWPTEPNCFVVQPVLRRPMIRSSDPVRQWQGDVLMDDEAQYFRFSLPKPRLALQGGEFRSSGGVIERGTFGGLTMEGEWPSRLFGGRNTHWGGAAISFYEVRSSPLLMLSDYEENIARSVVHVSLGGTTAWGPYTVFGRPLSFSIGRYVDLKTYHVFPLLTAGPTFSLLYRPTRYDSFFLGLAPMFQGSMNVAVNPTAEGIFDLSVPAFGSLFQTILATRRGEIIFLDDIQMISTFGWFENSMMSKLIVSIRSRPIDRRMHVFLQGGYLAERSTQPEWGWSDQEMLIQTGLYIQKTKWFQDVFIGPYYKLEHYRYGTPEILNQTFGLEIRFSLANETCKMRNVSDRSTGSREDNFVAQPAVDVLRTRTWYTDFVQELNTLDEQLDSEIRYYAVLGQITPRLRGLLKQTGSYIDQVQSMLEGTRYFTLPSQVTAAIEDASNRLTSFENNIQYVLAHEEAAYQALVEQRKELEAVILSLDQPLLPGVSVRTFMERPEQAVLQLLTEQINATLREKKFKWIISQGIEIQPADIAVNWIAVENQKIKRMQPVRQSDVLNWFYYSLEDEKDHLKHQILDLAGGRTAIAAGDVDTLMAKLPENIDPHYRESIREILDQVVASGNLSNLDQELEAQMRGFLQSDASRQAARLVENQFNRLVLFLRYNGRHFSKYFVLPSHQDILGVRLPGEEALQRDFTAMRSSNDF